MSERYLDFKQLSQKLSGRSRSSIDRDVKLGRLPNPLKMGQRVYWRESEVEQRLEQMMCDQIAESAI
jgi:predicted DNA-binding transcriptional regulator AlpA